MTEVDERRELARAYWSGKDVFCPRHAGAKMTGSFVQTTFADHIVLECSRGGETISIPQRPRQIELQSQQVEGLGEHMQRGAATLCYRCQSTLEVQAQADASTGVTDYTFTCIRCYSWGRWVGKPELAKIGA